ncbi:MAG TPA: hypothetical protein VM848_03375 [Acidimicrobiia bacterium]|nr:hypothetical protein [Acidimicrobiia bacterium]
MIPRVAVRLTAVAAVTTLLYDVASPIVLLVPVWAIVTAIAMLRIPERTLPMPGR